MRPQIIYTRPYRSLPARLFRGFLLFLLIGGAIESLIFSSIVAYDLLRDRAHHRAAHHLK